MSSSISIEHDEPLRDFAPVRRSAAQDKTLTLEARGLLLYLLSLPKGWEIRMDHLQRELEMGRDALRRVVRCLQESGYMHLETLPIADSGKFRGKRWRVYPIPTDPLKNQSVGKPVGREVRGCSDILKDRNPKGESMASSNEEETSSLASSGMMDRAHTREPEDGTQTPSLTLRARAGGPDGMCAAAPRLTRAQAATLKEEARNRLKPNPHAPLSVDAQTFLEDQCPLVAEHDPEIIVKLILNSWHHWNTRLKQWKPIRHWDKYLLEYEARLEKTHPANRKR